MKNWKETRNYRRIKDSNGNTIANIITVFDEDITVSDELFNVYAQMDAHARYITEDAPRNRELSLDQLLEDGAPVETLSHQLTPSAEEILLSREANQDTQHKTMLLKQAIAQLSATDRELIEALYFKNLSMREYARQIGVTHRTVSKRHNRILRTLKKFF